MAVHRSTWMGRPRSRRPGRSHQPVKHDHRHGDARSRNPNGSGVELGCGFLFTVSGLPTANFYTVTVDQVGSNPLSLSMVENDNWNVSLSIVPPYPGVDHSTPLS
jgi:hypothetical protein